MGLFKILTPAEEATFRQSAREHYKPLIDPINPLWHPAYQDECAKMNSEAGWNWDNPSGGSATLLRPAREG
jgi:hypothetical protein